MLVVTIIFFASEEILKCFYVMPLIVYYWYHKSQDYKLLRTVEIDYGITNA